MASVETLGNGSSAAMAEVTRIAHHFSRITQHYEQLRNQGPELIRRRLHEAYDQLHPRPTVIIERQGRHRDVSTRIDGIVLRPEVPEENKVLFFSDSRGLVVVGYRSDVRTTLEDRDGASASIPAHLFQTQRVPASPEQLIEHGPHVLSRIYALAERQRSIT